MERNKNFLNKLGTLIPNRLIEQSTNVGQRLLYRFSMINNLPRNAGGETTKIDKYIKEKFREIDNEIRIDPYGSQKPPDMILRDQHIELKSSSKGNFQFNDSQVKLDTIYIFIFTKHKIHKTFIIMGENLPVYPEEYKLGIDGLKTEWHPYFNNDAFYYGYPRPNVSIKPKFMEKLPDLSYFDGECLWIPFATITSIKQYI